MSDQHLPANVPNRYDGQELAPPGGGYYYPPTAAGYGYGAQEPGFDWQRLAGVLWARKWWILAVTLLAAGLGYLGTRYFIEPLYQASATIWLDQSEERTGPIQPDDIFAGEGWATLMRSHAVLQPVVLRHRLFITPEAPDGLDRDIFRDLEPGDRMAGGSYALFVSGDRYRLVHEERGAVESGRLGDPIGSAAGFTWRPDPETLRELGEVRFQLRSVLGGSLGLRGSLSSSYNGNSGLINASLVWDDPDEAARILNTVVDHFMETAHDLKNRKIEEVVDILEQQTEYAAEELRERELALESFRVQTITEPTEPSASPIPGGQATRGTVLGQYFEQRVEERQIQNDLQQIAQIMDRVQQGDSLNAFALGQIPSVAESQALRSALDELYTKEADRRALLYTFTEQAPEVQALTEEIRTLRQHQIPSILGSLAQELRNRDQVLDEQLSAQARELQQIPSRTIEEGRRNREFQLAQDLHNRLLSRLREAQLAQATSLPDMQIVDRAHPPFNPTRNEAPRIIMLASLAGLGLAVGGVLLLDRMDKRIRSPEQVTHQLGLPVLGIVPRLEAGPSSNGKALATVAIESFRAIRTQIAHAGTEMNRVVLITSPQPRDGKSMVAANLAISYASSGKRTILVDSDTRRGRAQEMFDRQKSPGLTDYLLDRASLEEVLQDTGVNHLTLLARGDNRGFNPELLESERMADLVARLGDAYDMVVLDAPPLAAGADTLVLGEYADKVVVVLRAGETNEDMARTKLDMVGNVELPFVGAVLNAVPESAPYYEYYANYYYVEEPA